MKNRLLTFSISALALLLVAIPLYAHHGGAVYGTEGKPTVLIGTVVSFEYINPHSVIKMDVKGSDGTAQHWVIEMSPPSLLVNRGITKTAMKAGDQIQLEVRPARNGATVGNFSGELMVNGVKVGR